MTTIGGRHRPARARAAAVVLVAAPLAIAAVLVLGGGQVRQCLGLSAAAWWRAMMAVVGLAAATALVVAFERAVEDRGRRAMAEDAALFGVGALMVAVPLVLAWVVLTARTPSVRPD